MHTRIVRLSIAVLVLLAWTVTSWSQTRATRHVMQEKLAHTQGILEALMKSDFGVLEREADALSRATEQPGWAVLTTPEYIRYSSAFRNAVADVRAAAVDHDLDAAALHYAGMTMACYQCHRYVKNARIASGR
jgi:hypothetical protein